MSFGPWSSPLQVTSFFEDLLQRAHPLSLFEKEPDCLFEIPQRLLLGATAGRHVEFARMRHEGPAFLENLSGELNLHTLPGYLSDAPEA
jgi:hypothetical protein